MSSAYPGHHGLPEAVLPADPRPRTVLHGEELQGAVGVQDQPSGLLVADRPQSGALALGRPLLYPVPVTRAQGSGPALAGQAGDDVPCLQDAFTDSGLDPAVRAERRLGRAAMNAGLAMEAGRTDTFDDPQVSPFR